MIWNASDTVSVVEIILYIPLLLAGFVVCARHGFSRTGGWIYTMILCLVRVIGAVCSLLASTNPSSGVIQAAVILDSVGLSPLLLATLGLLSRLYVGFWVHPQLDHQLIFCSVDWVNLGASNSMFTATHFRLLQVLMVVGLILSIAGGTSIDPTAGDSAAPPTTSLVGVVLFIIAFVGIFLVLLISSGNTSVVPKQERSIALVVALALPFIAVRLTYSALLVFVHSGNFSLLDGSTAVRAGMALIPEIIVVSVYILLGFRLDKLSSGQHGPILSRPWKKERKGRQRAVQGYPIYQGEGPTYRGEAPTYRGEAPTYRGEAPTYRGEGRDDRV